MCGIFCSLSSIQHIPPSDTIANRLRSRGPDSHEKLELTAATCAGNGDEARRDVFVTLYSTVLSLRGKATVRQPYQDDTGRYTLCWNGEAWSIAGQRVHGNDTELVYKLLSNALETDFSGGRSASTPQRATRISRALSMVAGPYAFVFFDHVHNTLYFGRDFLGRRSLLTKTTPHGDVVISSVTDGNADSGWKEIEADGVYCIDLDQTSPGSSQLDQSVPGPAIAAYILPYQFIPPRDAGDTAFRSVIPHLSLNHDTSPSQSPLSERSLSVTRLEELLRESLALRATNIPPAPTTSNIAPNEETSRLAILFSGGLDCTVLARISHDLLPACEHIDLLNVAFENPRIHRNKTQQAASETDSFELCPDRVTGRASHAELRRICPNRTWRFVAINIPYAEFTEHRDEIISLMHPHNTEMDLSIASALYFAARGKGQTSQFPEHPPKLYTTNARVLLSGLGADEIFAGYTRHATAFKRNGFDGLLDELQLDVGRLGKRNLGRDDRVMSHWGKEVRFPYLDESLLPWALNAPISSKCGFGEVHDETVTADDSSALEPGKKALRCLAWKLGMKDVAREKKRAIQFGARTAKMETGKTKGTQVLS